MCSTHTGQQQTATTECFLRLADQLAGEPAAAVKLIHRLTLLNNRLPAPAPAPAPLTELLSLMGGVGGRTERAALTPLPATRRPAVLLLSGRRRKVASPGDGAQQAGPRRGISGSGKTLEFTAGLRPRPAIPR